MSALGLNPLNMFKACDVFYTALVSLRELFYFHFAQYKLFHTNVSVCCPSSAERQFLVKYKAMLEITA